MPLFAKFDEKKRDRFLGALRKGLRIGQACRAAGISHETVHNYRQAHPEFQAEMDKAEAAYCEEVEQCLLAAIKDNLNFPAMVFWLTNRAPDRWKDRRNANKIEVNTPSLAPEQLEAVKTELLKKLDKLK